VIGRAEATLNKQILIPLPSYGFDPTETAIPWKVLKSAGFRIIFATPEAQVAAADRRTLTGEGLPSILVGSFVASPEAVQTYSEMTASEEFQDPIAYRDIQPDNYDALILPGGHDKGMREYLESETLRLVVAYFFDRNKPVGAICHGLLLPARTRTMNNSNRSVLWGKRTTSLTRRQERLSYQLTRLWIGDHYQTYKTLVQDEVISNLCSPDDYVSGPEFFVPVQRDTETDLSPGFAVVDGNFVSARWPGDIHKFTYEFKRLLEQ
jgi:putative intracellular protease/amidase